MPRPMPGGIEVRASVTTPGERSAPSGPALPASGSGRTAREGGSAVKASVGPYALIGTYHPSQQNTFTGKLTAPMMEAVLRRAREIAELP